MPGPIVPDPGFRTAQAVSDLVAHVKPLLPPSLGALARASGLSIVQTGEALQLLRDDQFHFGREETFALLDGAEHLALAQGEGFEIAIVLLLADLLQTRAASGLPPQAWADAQVRLRAWPDTLRAAVANGLRRAVDLGLMALDTPPGADGVTRPAEAIAEPLLRIARAMRPDELDAVALADYGNDAERHLAALKDVIRNRAGLFPEGEAWFPAEAVERVAHDPEAPGFEGCTALMLVNVLAQGALQGDVSFRWQHLAPAYTSLRPSARDPVLAAVRYLYETDPTFAPQGIPIPVVHDLT
jgi:hypothetical protein